MTGSWKITAYASKPLVHQALLAHEEETDWDPEVILSGREETPQTPNNWVLEAWYSRKPVQADKAAVAALFGDDVPALGIEKLPDEDWLTISQQGVKPIHAGQFYVHTPDYPPHGDPAVCSLSIPASQAFGTGHHETTAGCLAILTAMKRSGVVARHIADIGTGTGLLAFAALDLWPNALATASDIDAICAEVVEFNAAENHVAMGPGNGQLAMVIADGMDDPLLQARGPYDLLIANILAAPLIELGPDFAEAVSPGGHVVLAGLLETQEAKVRAAYRRAGFRLASRLVNGDWSILWLRRRRA